MNSLPILAAACVLPWFVSSVNADSPFYGDPPDETHPWAIHDPNRPQPPLVNPGTFSSQEEPGKPPSDAVILFDGSEDALENWTADKDPVEPTEWIVKDGAMQCVPGSGYVRSKEEFGDCQLHIEWAAPSEVKGRSQGRGNSGVFLMGMVEVQVLDNHENPTYADGFAGSVYGVNPPMANALRAPGEWQTYDIVFRRPVFEDGEEVDPGYLTVFLNGVLVQDHTPIEGGGGHRGRSKSRPFPEVGPLKLQDHGNPVRFRNIWYRPLPARTVEGGTDGQLSPEATMEKREEIAASIREDAQDLEGRAKMLRLMESLCYTMNEDALEESRKMAAEYADSLEALSPEEQEDRKGEISQVRNAVKYLNRHDLIPAPYDVEGVIDKIALELEWDEKK